MPGSQQQIVLTTEEFERLQPVGGNIIVKSTMDMTKAQYKSLIIDIDTSYKPENHQEVLNIVEKIPDNGKYASQELRSKVAVAPGDRVVVNYYPILQAPVLLVEGIVYRIVPYYWLICKLYEILPTKPIKKLLELITDPGIEMLNDFVMIDRIPLPLQDMELEIHQKNSPIYFEVFAGNYNEGFEYLRRSNKLLRPNPGDVVVLKDSAVLAVEADMHLSIDGNKKHYVTRLWKVLSIVGQPQES